MLYFYQCVPYFACHIILYLKDGSVIELDKNRRIEGDYVIKNEREGVISRIELSDILKADFYAA
jgi:hypothetical protein